MGLLLSRESFSEDSRASQLPKWRTINSCGKLFSTRFTAWPLRYLGYLKGYLLKMVQRSYGDYGVFMHRQKILTHQTLGKVGEKKTFEHLCGSEQWLILFGRLNPLATACNGNRNATQSTTCNRNFNVDIRGHTCAVASDCNAKSTPREALRCLHSM